MNKKLIVIITTIISLLGAIGAYKWFQKYQHQKDIQRITNLLKGHDDRPQAERDFENYKLNGIVEFNNRQFANAVQQFITALALKPEDIEARLFVVSAYKRSGSYELAEEFLINSLEILPQNPKLLTEMGYVYLDWGKLEKAREVFQKLVDSKIDSLEGYDGLAEVELKQQRYDSAIQYFNKSRPILNDLIKKGEQKDKVGRSLFRFAAFTKSTGRSELAITYFLKLLKINSLDFNIHYELGQLYEYLKDKEKAIHYYDTVLQLATTLDQEKIDFAKQRIEALNRGEFLLPPPVVPLK